MRVLLTAFEPYGGHAANASSLSLAALGEEAPQGIELVRRTYPVDFARVPLLLAEDLANGFDVALHLGQAPGSTSVALEAFAVNAAVDPERPERDFTPLLAEGPPGYQSTLPLSDWARRLREAGIPAVVSFHAGTYLCNAVLYHSLHWSACASSSRPLRSAFIHLPLETSQALAERRPSPSLPAAATARGVRLLLEELARHAWDA